MLNGLRDLSLFLPEGTNMIEIGCYSGESTRVWLGSGKIKNIYCIDPWTGVINNNTHYNLDVMQKVEAKFNELLTDSRVTKLKGFSSVHLPTFIKSTTRISAIYIDGDHSYEAVKKDIEMALKVLEPNGIICGHDINHAGAGKAIKETLGFVDVQFADSSWLKFVNRLGG